MKFGFYTACLPNVDLKKLVNWAANNHFKTLEIACWPVENDRKDYSGSSIDVANLTKEGAERVNGIFNKHNMKISSLAYYDNNLHQDLDKRKKYHDHLKKVIRAAKLLGVEMVGTFIGRDNSKSIEENIEEYSEVFPPLVRYAEDHNVKLMLENCPMEGWHPEGQPGNLAYSPELLKKIFEIIPSPNFGLNLDPSHLYWLGINYIQVVEEFGNRIFHVHAKDTEIIKEGRYRYGIFGKKLDRQHSWDIGWWRYRVPGLGEIDWETFLDKLSQVGYDGVVSTEHEDPVWEGDENKVKKGLIIGREYLEKVSGE